VASEYRLAPALVLRLLGVLAVALGVAVLVLVVVVSVLGLPPVVLYAGAGVVVLSLLAAGSTLRACGVVMRLDDIGYRVRLVRGAGTTRARWADVEDVVATTVAGSRCVVIRLRDGRTTTVPVSVLATDVDPFLTDLQAHLNRGHGYRRIR
jgi:NADH:ubiquinone oxidoreductase subunit 2 (subunit N)